MHSHNWYEEHYKEQERVRLGLPPRKESSVNLAPSLMVSSIALKILNKQLNKKENK